MLSSVNRIAKLSLVFSLALTAAAQAAGGVRLSAFAAQDGYSYQWMTTEAGVTLIRPGVRIVIRAGRLLYEVNNATPIADEAPRFDGRDLVISQKLADHLRAIALKYPNEPRADLGDPEVGRITGALTISARQIPGRETLAITGTGPANVPITITLTGEVSSDLPVVTLIKKTVLTGTDGSFFAEAYYGQESHANTTLAVTATSVDDVMPATTKVVISIPSAQIKSSALDAWPKK